MHICSKVSDTTRHALTHILMVVLIVILAPEASLASKKTPDAARARVLVLSDWYSDYTPPSKDVVIMLNSKGESVRVIRSLNISSSGGGHRAISASDEGRFFVVCENEADKLSAYDTSTGAVLWSLSGVFRSAAIANGVVYAVNIGAPDTGSVFAINSTGTIVKHSRVGGMDIAADPSRDCLWMVGFDIKKCNLDLQVVLAVDPIKAYAVSVDVSPDGSIWVAERKHSDVKRSKNRLLRISPQGAILEAIDLNWSPLCVRVDRSDGSVWATGITYRSFDVWDDDWVGTYKYDPEGKLLVKIAQGGHSIGLDPSDGSVWIAGRTRQVWHYSRNGTKLGTCLGGPAGQKWVAVIHGESEGS